MVVKVRVSIMKKQFCRRWKQFTCTMAVAGMLLVSAQKLYAQDIGSQSATIPAEYDAQTAVAIQPKQETSTVGETSSAVDMQTTNETQSAVVTDITNHTQSSHSQEFDLSQITPERGMGFVAPDDVDGTIRRVRTEDELAADGIDFPSFYRNYDVPIIRNQYESQWCWAFTCVATIEINLIKKGLADTSIDLSEAQLAYFAYHNTPDNLGGKSGDVNESSRDRKNRDGNSRYASRALIGWEGLASEETIPFNIEYIDDSMAYNNNIAHLEGYYNLESAEEIKQAILDYGSAGISYYVDGGRSIYYNESNHSYYCDQKNNTTHMVTLIGWDDTYSRYNFNYTPERDGAWIVRNSWGEGYGEGGYFYLSYDDKSAGYAFAMEADVAGKYHNNYQYDGGMFTASYSSCQKVANVFTAKANYGQAEEIRAVSFMINGDTNVDYAIRIYTDVNNGDTLSFGKPVYVQKGKTSYEGTYTVPLNNPVYVEDGTNYAVVIALDEQKSASITHEMSYDYYYELSGYRSTVYADAHQSYAYLSGEWKDYGQQFGENLVIKAYTNNVDKRLPELKASVRSSVSSLAQGHNVTFIAGASGGNGGYQYRFLLQNPTTGNWNVLQDYSSASRFTWKANSGGKKRIYVDVKDQAGNVKRSNPIAVTVSVVRPKVTVSGSASKADTGNKIRFTAKLSGGSGTYQYRFLLKNPKTNKYTVLKDYSGTNTYVWTAGGEGTRHVYVDVKDSGGVVTRSSPFGITVTKKIVIPPLKAQVTLSKSIAQKGDNIRITAKASGGTGKYQYRFLLKNPKTNNVIVLRDYSSSAAYVWKVSGEGARHIYVDVKDGRGVVVRSSAYGVNLQKVLKSSFKLSKTVVQPGEKVRITAKASGGNGGYQYRYLLQNPTTGKWAELKKYSASSSYTWTATGSGKRRVYVDVKDSRGRIVRSGAQAVRTIIRPKVTVTAPSSVVMAGTKVRLQAKLSGGNGKYQYRFLLKNPKNNHFIVLRDYSSNNAYMWPVSGEGARHIYVDVKDSEGIVTRSSAFGVKIQKALKSNFTLSTSVAQAGSSVKITASASGGNGGYQYRYLLQNPTTKKWVELKKYSKSNTYTWKASGSGKRRIYVDVKDSRGRIVRSGAKAVTTVVKPKVTFKGNVSTIRSGGKIRFTAKVGGGSGKYQYRYMLKNPATNNWVILKDYSASNTFVWTAGGKGARHVYVEVKDQYGIVTTSNIFGVTVQ